MGLDMYAFVARTDLIGQDVDVKLSDLPHLQRVHYWRKHPNLHGWMEALYRQKGGVAEDFGGDDPCVRPRVDDLDALEVAVRTDRLPVTTGFFFGVSDGTEHENDLEFIDTARQAIARGWAVFYRSSW